MNIKYVVRYYFGGGTRTAKYFDTIHDALQFSIRHVRLDNFYEISKEEV